MVHTDNTASRLVGVVLARIAEAGVSQRQAALRSGLPWSTFKRCIDTGRLDVSQAEAMARLMSSIEGREVTLSALLRRADGGEAA
jgi:hypothetical protein